jgi:iron-sulfur cluster assembly protein
MITLTDKAASKVKEILQDKNIKTSALRVGVKGGGCSGFTYTLDFDENAGETDQVFENKGVKIVVDAKSFVFLSGTELDYSDGLTGAGFTFQNPNATRSCGCGSSFQA